MHYGTVSGGAACVTVAIAVACRLVLSLFICGAGTGAEGQESSVAFDSEFFQQQDRAFTFPYPRPVEHGHCRISIDHRTFQPLDEAPGETLLGFDSGNLKIGLGLRYGIMDDLDAGVARFNGTTDDVDDYEFDIRYRPIDEGDDIIDLALVAGIVWFDGASGTNDYPFFARILAGRTVLNRAYTSAGVAYHSLSRSPGKTADDTDHSVAVVAALEVALLPAVSLATEWSFPVGGYDAGEPAWSVGPKFRTLGHSFSVVISNTQNISADGIVTGSNRRGDPIIGFTITRKI